ncbi:magnesium chelatase ATPase subunit D [Sulfitobacter aestuariivivens]|uniref:magnesium chelatase ATPase subunit D n=1 Tax=Sulfitobacter aestuariivivens TaxID=2766981 RepID=UPI003610213A
MTDAWDRAMTALALLAIDPMLGGIHLRARAGPARQAFVDAAASLPHPALRLHPAMSPEQIDGGVDLTATLQHGALTQTRGLLDRAPSILTLAMAERVEPYLAARLGASLDAQDGHILIAMDEGLEDETVPESLSDRLAFQLHLDGLAMGDIGKILLAPKQSLTKRISAPDDSIELLVDVAVRLGIRSLRAVGFALRAAKAHAALNDRNAVTEEDIHTAIALVLAPRATQLPTEDTQDTPPPDIPEDQASQTPESLPDMPDEMLLDAVQAVLPTDMLDKLQTGQNIRTGSGAGAGARKIGNRRGRPLPARNTRTTRSDARVDLMATLRAALPWQTIRKQARPDHKGAHIRPSDLRHKRYQNLSDRLLIFTVDASGSAAIARLGEAKGAVELLLGQAYARRDHVALVAFRGTEAELLLPPTRSLVQTKRRLASLPGGGATPWPPVLKPHRNWRMSARARA